MKEQNKLQYDEMMEAMIEVAKANMEIAEIEEDEYESEEIEDIFTPDCSTEIQEFFTEPTESEKYIIQQVSDRGAEGDGADMFLTFKIQDKVSGKIGFLEYSGRYGSWDSSEYYESYAVEPKEVMYIEYQRLGE